MNLTLSSLVLLILILPGAGFQISFYHAGRIVRNVSPPSFVSLTALTCVWAAFVHLLCGVLFLGLEVLLHPVWLEQVKMALKHISFALADDNVRYTWWKAEDLGVFVLSYVILSFAIGVLLGKAVINTIDSGRLKIRMFHGALYDHIVGPESPMILAYVLTKVEHDGRVLMYRGFVKELGIEKGRKIAYIVMIGAARFFMKMNDKSEFPSTSDKKSYKIIGVDPDIEIDESKIHTTLLIDGEEISNVVLDSYQLKL